MKPSFFFGNNHFFFPCSSARRMISCSLASSSRLPISFSTTSIPHRFTIRDGFPECRATVHAFLLGCSCRGGSSISRSRRWPCASSSPVSVICEDEWLQKLPDKKKPLYSHSLPCIEAWLRSLGFVQSKEDRAAWIIERPDWHARLSLDMTDLFIRYWKSGPGNLDRDVERKFSYALSREDLENAILGGP